MKLDRQSVLSQALALMEEEGLAAVSLRRLAERLDARAPSLARHVGDKESLLALMADAVFRDLLATLPACEKWEDLLRAFGRAMWRVLNDKRDIIRLVVAAPASLQNFASTNRELLGILEAVGLDPEIGQQMQGSVQALAIGWALFKQSPMAPLIETLTPIDTAFEDGLDVLILGWRARMAAKPGRLAKRA